MPRVSDSEGPLECQAPLFILQMGQRKCREGSRELVWVSEAVASCSPVRPRVGMDGSSASKKGGGSSWRMVAAQGWVVEKVVEEEGWTWGREGSAIRMAFAEQLAEMGWARMGTSCPQSCPVEDLGMGVWNEGGGSVCQRQGVSGLC